LIDVLAETDSRKRIRGRERMCAVTRRVLPEGELIRFVAAPDGTVVADLKARLPGRGVWVGLDRSCVAEAAKKNAFARGLKRPVTPPADLAGEVSVRLREAALGRLGLARKAGAVVAGFAKVEGALERGGLAALLIARDAAADGRRKMEQALHRSREAGSVPVIGLFDSVELGLATGRANVIHAAVLQSPAGKSFLDAANRFRRYEGGVGEGEPQGAVGLQEKLNE